MFTGSSTFAEDDNESGMVGCGLRIEGGPGRLGRGRRRVGGTEFAYFAAGSPRQPRSSMQSL